ncbi:MAG: autotransporter-associated beta strand repeat-containing protein, partial [Burkholderiales bacterium]|nr:autotransporter-associated beta strand repeat-containing protein [Opitutaceae bacterium]
MKHPRYLKLLASLAAPLALATLGYSQTWVGTTSGATNLAANWNPVAVPANNATAIFNNNPTNVTGMNTTITIPNVSIQFNIDTANAAAFTFNGGPIRWASGGTLTVTSTVQQSQIFNASILMEPRTSAATNTINANGGGGSTLTINGNYSGGLSVATLASTLNLHGSGTGYGIFNGVISDGTNGGRTVVGRTAAPNNATWEINGANTYTGGTEYGRAGQNNGLTILGHRSALGTGTLRLINGSTAPTLAANKDLSDLRGTGGANNALANAISFNSPLGITPLTGKTVTLTLGSNTATINDAAGVVPGLSIVAANFLPIHTVVTAVNGNQLTLSANAAANTPVPPAAATAATINNYSASGGALAVSGTQNLEFSGPVDLTPVYASNGTPGTVTFNITNTASTIFSGPLRQNGGFAIGTAGTFGNVASLAKIGVGTLTLAGTNSYTGTTTVTAGTLRVSGSIAASTATPVAPDRAVVVAEG